MRQITDIEIIQDVMIQIGKDSIIQAFEEKININWKNAKMSKFTIYEFQENSSIWYDCGRYPYGSEVIRFESSFLPPDTFKPTPIWPNHKMPNWGGSKNEK